MIWCQCYGWRRGETASLHLFSWQESLPSHLWAAWLKGPPSCDNARESKRVIKYPKRITRIAVQDHGCCRCFDLKGYKAWTYPFAPTDFTLWSLVLDWKRIQRRRGMRTFDHLKHCRNTTGGKFQTYLLQIDVNVSASYRQVPALGQGFGILLFLHAYFSLKDIQCNMTFQICFTETAIC